MKKTKFLVTAFAVFGAVLMLMATCMARPVQERASIEAVEFAEKELMNSFDALNVKLSRDVEINVLINAITRDPDVSRIVNRIGRSSSEEGLTSGLEQLAVVLQDKSEFGHLAILVEEEYSAEAEAISGELSSMGYNTCGLEDIITIIILIIKIIQTVIQIILTIIGLINLIKTLLGLLGDLWDLINDGGDDGGVTVYHNTYITNGIKQM